MDLQNSRELITIFLGLILFLCLLSSIWRKRSRKEPPEASGAWPLIGHLYLLGRSKAPHVTLGNMGDKHGPIFTVRLGVHKTLIVSNSEMAKQCFTVNDKAFANRPKTLAFEVLGYNYSMIGVSPYGSYWRQVRKIATSELLSARGIEMLKDVIESEVKAAVKESYNVWLNNKKSGSENVGDDERIRKLVRDLFDLSGSFAISDALPYLRWLDLDGREKEMKRTAKELDEFVQVWLQEHKRNRNCGSAEGKDNHDFMDVLLSLVEKGEEFDGHDADTTIKATCLALIVAGTDTTTGTMIWTPSLLLNNHEILNKVVHELDIQIGKKLMVEVSDLEKLEYLESIIKETLRLYPVGPLSMPHECIEDCIVGGYHVSTGTRLLTNISKLQRDPSLYSDPLEFRPERFLTTHKDLDTKGQHFKLIPFGAGRRMCPGLSFSLQIMKLMLATLLHGFDIATPDGRSVDMLEHIGLTNIKASPLQVILTPRLSTHIYDGI